MEKINLEQEIIKQELFIEEEQRCLNFCLANPDECDDGEVEERVKYHNELIKKSEKIKTLVNK